MTGICHRDIVDKESTTQTVVPSNMTMHSHVYRLTDRHTDGQRERWTEKGTDGRYDPIIPLFRTWFAGLKYND